MFEIYFNHHQVTGVWKLLLLTWKSDAMLCNTTATSIANITHKQRFKTLALAFMLVNPLSTICSASQGSLLSQQELRPPQLYCVRKRPNEHKHITMAKDAKEHCLCRHDERFKTKPKSLQTFPCTLCELEVLLSVFKSQNPWKRPLQSIPALQLDPGLEVTQG